MEKKDLNWDLAAMANRNHAVYDTNDLKIADEESRDLALDNLSNFSQEVGKKTGKHATLQRIAYVAAIVGVITVGTGIHWYHGIVKETKKDTENSKCLETEYHGVPLNKIITNSSTNGIKVFINGHEESIDDVMDAMDSALTKAGYTENQTSFCEEEYLGVNKDYSKIGFVRDYRTMKEKGEMFYSGVRYTDTNASSKGRN